MTSVTNDRNCVRFCRIIWHFLEKKQKRAEYEKKILQIDIYVVYCLIVRLYYGTIYTLPAGDVFVYFGDARLTKNLIILSLCLLVFIPTLWMIQACLRTDVMAGYLGIAETRILDSADVISHERDASAESLADTAASETGDVGAETADSSFSADAPSYQSLYPEFFAPQPFTASERKDNTVYLTFDDGPSERTDDILQILAEKNVKATFFVIGQSGDSAEINLDRMRRIAAAGHTVGMHSYSHIYSSVYASVEDFLDDFYRNFAQIRDTTGIAPSVFRFPGGSINGYDSGIYQELISEMLRRGFLPFDWNVSSEDATGERLTADQITDNVVKGVQGKVRAVVLFHDSEPKTATVQALGTIIDRLSEMGYEFEAITPATLPVLYSYQY